jgi:hypothetical protein
MEKTKNPSHFPTIEEKYELTDSVLECIKNDYESGEYTVQQTADLWNLKLESIRQLSRKNNWLCKSKRIALETELTENPKLLNKLSNPRNQCHQELSPAELLIVKKAETAVTVENLILDISVDALKNLKRDGLTINSAFDFKHVTEAAKNTLGLDKEDSAAAATVNLSFTSRANKPQVVVDVD